MGWISDTWAEITSGGSAVTDTYNSNDDDDWYSGPNLDGSSGYTVDWGDNGSDDNYDSNTGYLTNTNDVTTTTSGGTSEGPSNDEWKTTTIDGHEVQYKGTMGSGDFVIKDTSFVDPYEYLELIGGDLVDNGEKNENGDPILSWSWENKDNSTVYSDNAAFDMSHYAPNEDYKADAAFYKKNPNSTITTEQYVKMKKISTALGIFAGPIGLGARAMIELQRRGILPGNTATSWFENNNVSETTGSPNDDKILNLIESGASNDEIQDAINEIAIEEDISSISTAVGIMADDAFGTSNASDVAVNPGNYFSDTNLTDSVPTLDANAEGTTIDKENYQKGENVDVPLSIVSESETVTAPEAGTAVGYDVETVDGKLDQDQYQADAVVGELSDGATIDAEQIDVEATANGINAVGKALNDFAKVDLSRVIDTSTVQGKLLADRLGEGNYIDAKATILGQMKIISEEFKDSQGNPKIPAWAQGTARNVAKTIAFKGMSGSAAVAAMSNAIMESSLGVAEKEATFFQTLTYKNLDNRQEALIQKASVLANFELANLDARMEAAVSNAKAVLAMDLKNTDNKQQAEILNTQIRVDGLFEDAKAKNAERMFSADAENDFTKFYDQLSTQVAMHRADTLNEMARFNAGETNSNSQFKASQDVKLEMFYKEMQYNVDLAATKWRQAVLLEEASMKFEAAKFDTQNMFDLTNEALNRVWDREDAQFDYIWKSAETEKERMVDLYEIDKDYEVGMRKVVNDEQYRQGQADWELFKWGTDLIFGDDWDVWDIF